MSLYEHTSQVNKDVLLPKSLYDKILITFSSFTIIMIAFNFIMLGDVVFRYQEHIIGYLMGVLSLILLIFSLIRKNPTYFLLLAILYAICFFNNLYGNYIPDDDQLFWTAPNAIFSRLYYFSKINTFLNIDLNLIRSIFDFFIPTLLFTFFFFQERSKEKKLLSNNSSF